MCTSHNTFNLEPFSNTKTFVFVVSCHVHKKSPMGKNKIKNNTQLILVVKNHLEMHHMLDCSCTNGSPRKNEQITLCENVLCTIMFKRTK
jgi:hypothetical protein